MEVALRRFGLFAQHIHNSLLGNLRKLFLVLGQTFATP